MDDLELLDSLAGATIIEAKPNYQDREITSIELELEDGRTIGFLVLTGTNGRAVYRSDEQ